VLYHNLVLVVTFVALAWSEMKSVFGSLNWVNEHCTEYTQFFFHLDKIIMFLARIS